MDFKKFVENMQMDLPKSLSETFHNISVEPAEVTKLQGQSYTGISVRKDESAIGMTVNLNPFFREYEAGTAYEEVLQGITDFVTIHISQTPEFNLEMLNSYETMKPYLSVQIVGKKSNEEQLATIPHQIMEDMAVVYRFNLGEISDGRASVLVTNHMLETYGVAQEQLHQDAMQMMEKKEPMSIKNMDEIMYEMTGGMMGSLEDAFSPMYVATNESKFNGAAVMTYPDFMDKAAEKLEGSFYILPSSIHEIIMIPDYFGMKAAELKAMVTEINGTQVSRDEKLTDNVYHYDAAAKAFEQAEKFEKRIEKEQSRKSVLGMLDEKKQECRMTEPKTQIRQQKTEPVL